MSRDATPMDVVAGRARWCVVTEDNNHVGDIPAADVVVLDPPYDEWSSVSPLLVGSATTIAFVNHQNRRDAERVLGGPPRTELVWHFRDGRWVSPRLPRITHASILVYGETGDAAVGEPQVAGVSQKKGMSSIGKDTLGPRVYVTKERKHIDSVLSFPRNVSNEAGCFGKPVALMETLCRWVGGNVWLDPFCGSGTTGVACLRTGRRFVGIEINSQFAEVSRERLEAESKGLTLRDLRAGQVSIFNDGGVP